MPGRTTAIKPVLIIVGVLLTASMAQADAFGSVSDSSVNDVTIAVSLFAGPEIVFERLRDVGQNGIAFGFELGVRDSRWNFDVGVGFAGPRLDDEFITKHGIDPDSFHIEGIMWHLQCGRRFDVSQRIGFIPMLGVGYLNVRESSYPDGMELKDLPVLESSSYPVPLATLRLCRFTEPGASKETFFEAGLIYFLELQVSWFDFGDSPLSRGPALRLTFGITGEKRVSR